MTTSWIPPVVTVLLGMATYAVLRHRNGGRDADGPAGPGFGAPPAPRSSRSGRHLAPGARRRTIGWDASLAVVVMLITTTLWFLLPATWPNADGSDPGPAPAVPPRTQSTTADADTPAAADPAADTAADLAASVTIRGIFGRDTSPSGFANIAAAGFNTVMVDPDPRSLDQLTRYGLRGVVWLGDYDTTEKCQFERSDEAVKRAVTAVADHPAVVAYYLADEPSLARTEGCPNAPQAISERSALVKELDPDTPTFVTLTTWDGAEQYPFEYFAGTADIFGLVVYPCYEGTCDFTMIETAIGEADADGLGQYWAIVQDFATAWYDLPSAESVDVQMSAWSQSNMTGYAVYAAGGFSCCRGSDFETNSAKREALERWNRA